MRTVRWIAFIPVAIVASVFAGAMGAVALKAAGSPSLASYVVSGAFSGVALMMAGLKTAPRRTRGVKMALIALLVILGLLSALGGLVGTEKLAALTGLTMIAVGVASIKLSPTDLMGETEAAKRPDEPGLVV